MTFIDFARAHGVEIDPNKLFASEKIRRCGTVAKPRSDNGAFYWNGERGWVMDWSGDARVMWWQDPNAKPWSDEEKRAWHQRRQQSQSEQEQRYEKAAVEAESIVLQCTSETHPYLEHKGFSSDRGLVYDDRLIIPMRNVSTNRMQGYQEIFWDRDAYRFQKKMLYGMRAKNAVFTIGSRDEKETWLCEGYATGLSVRAGLRSVGSTASVIVTFSATNLLQVHDQIPGQVFVFADNDESKTGQKTAEATGRPWTMADTVGWDANDLHQNSGVFAVAQKIMQLKIALRDKR